MRANILFAIGIMLAVLSFILVLTSPYGGSPAGRPEKRTETIEGTAASVEAFVNQMLSQEIRREETSSTTGLPFMVSAVEPLEKLCEGENRANFDCYETYFQNAVKEQGIVLAFDVLKTIYPANEYARAQCHPITHVIGREASKKFATVADAYTQGDSFCWSGYYHGVLEGVIASIGYSNLVKQMENICSPLAKARQYSFDHYNCVHGLGHGVMAALQNELFESLDTCNMLSDAWERQSCWSGAFMENIIVDNKNHFTAYLKAEEPLYPCTAVAEQYKGTCYLMQTSYMLKVSNGSFATVFEQCQMADKGFEAICYQSLGETPLAGA